MAIDVLVAIAAVMLIALLVYWRSVTRTHVASLFRSTVRQFMAEGDGMEPAMQDAIRRFARRAPFSLIRPEEFSFFISVLQDLGAPVDVGAEILQLCENRHSISEIRDRQKMAHLAYSTDLKLGLQRLLQTAETLHKEVGHRYPNITIALLASLGGREGWTFVEEQNDALIFDCRQRRVRIPKQGSGKDAARLILFEEMAQKPILSPPGTGFEARKSARQEFVDNFAAVFDEIFLEMAKSD
jgi:hypothetical protein